MINIETQDIFMHPSESYLLIEGRLTKTAAEKRSDQATFNLGFKIRSDHIIVKPGTKGKFSFCVPLKHIFGFAKITIKWYTE